MQLNPNSDCVVGNRESFSLDQHNLFNSDYSARLGDGSARGHGSCIVTFATADVLSVTGG